MEPNKNEASITSRSTSPPIKVSSKRPPVAPHESAWTGRGSPLPPHVAAPGHCYEATARARTCHTTAVPSTAPVDRGRGCGPGRTGERNRGTWVSGGVPRPDPLVPDPLRLRLDPSRYVSGTDLSYYSGPADACVRADLRP